MNEPSPLAGPVSERSSPLNSSLSSASREPLDRDTVQIEAELGNGPCQLTRAIETRRKLWAFEPRIGYAPFAAHQGAERELHPQGARTHLVGLIRSAERDVVQHERRGRKQTCVDAAGDVKVEAGEAAGAR